MTSGGLQGKLQVWGLVVCVGAGKGTDLWCGGGPGGSSEAAAVKGEESPRMAGSLGRYLVGLWRWPWKCVV